MAQFCLHLGSTNAMAAFQAGPAGNAGKPFSTRLAMDEDRVGASVALTGCRM